MSKEQEYAVCNHCTYKLVAIAYKRAPLFRLFREPLKMGMRYLAWIHRVDARQYKMRTPNCYQCIRFYKTALFGKSVSFRWLHNRFNPVFNKLIARIVPAEERKKAKIYADAASEGKVSQEEADEWMKDLKASL
ncbi:nitroreductase [Chloroflexota bacterium]